VAAPADTQTRSRCERENRRVSSFDLSPWEAAAGSSSAALAGLVGRGVDQTSTGSCDQAYALPASQRPTASRTWRAGYAPAMAGTPTRCGYCGRQTITSARALPGLRPGQAAVGDDGAAAPGSVWRLMVSRSRRPR
jgi:hypothetical protein